MRNPFKSKPKIFFKILERFRGNIPKSDRPDWVHFNFQKHCDMLDNYEDRYPKLKATIWTIAGLTVEKGLFVTPSDDYDRAVEAADECDKLNQKLGLDLMIYSTAARMVKYGTAFWEKDVSAWDARPIPLQKYIAPKYGDDGEVAQWDWCPRSGDSKHSWSTDQIMVFPLGESRWPPFGKSLLTGIDYELETIDHIRKALNAYLDKQAWASNVLQLGGEPRPQSADVAAVETKIKNREPGEDFVTNADIELKVMGAAQIETRMVPDTLAFLDDQVVDASLVPPVSKLYNSTEASAKVMRQESFARIVGPVQRIIKRVVENELYFPYLESRGFSVKVLPSLSFEPPRAEITETAEYIVQLVVAGVISPKTAAKELGFEDEFEQDGLEQMWKDKIEWQKKQPQMAQQQQEGKTGEVWEVRRKKRTLKTTEMTMKTREITENVEDCNDELYRNARKINSNRGNR